MLKHVFSFITGAGSHHWQTLLTADIVLFNQSRLIFVVFSGENPLFIHIHLNGNGCLQPLFVSSNFKTLWQHSRSLLNFVMSSLSSGGLQNSLPHSTRTMKLVLHYIFYHELTVRWYKGMFSLNSYRFVMLRIYCPFVLCLKQFMWDVFPRVI